MNIKVPEPREKSKSRKVNGYIKAELTRLTLHRAYLEADDEVKVRRGALTGGQIAEADRILSS